MYLLICPKKMLVIFYFTSNSKIITIYEIYVHKIIFNAY